MCYPATHSEKPYSKLVRKRSWSTKGLDPDPPHVYLLEGVLLTGRGEGGLGRPGSYQPYYLPTYIQATSVPTYLLQATSVPTYYLPTYLRPANHTPQSTNTTTNLTCLFVLPPFVSPFTRLSKDLDQRGANCDYRLPRAGQPF